MEDCVSRFSVAQLSYAAGLKGYLDRPAALEFLKTMDIKHSVGHWSAGDFCDRFAPPGYHSDDPGFRNDFEGQCRRTKAAGIDAIQDGIREARQAGAADLVELLDAQLADEVQHVRYANEWVKRLVERGGPDATFQVVRSVSQANAAMRQVAGEALTSYPVAVEVRLEAGFEPGEIEAVKSAGRRS